MLKKELGKKGAPPSLYIIVVNKVLKYLVRPTENVT